jgi:hypothetical protein
VTEDGAEVPEDAVVPEDALVPEDAVDAVVADEPLLVALGVELDATTEVADFFVLELASAGSWPVTICTVMNPNAATNNATAPPTMRRRIMPIRRARAARLASASLRRSSAVALVGVMFIGLAVLVGQMSSAQSVAVLRIKAVRSP